MANVWMIYAHYKEGLKAGYQWMIEAGEESDCQVTIFFEEELSLLLEGQSSTVENEKTLPDVVVMRCYNYMLSQYFESKNIPVINSGQSMMSCRDKLLTSTLLVQHNIPTPKTYFTTLNDYNHVSEVFHQKPFILKHRFGEKGKNVYLIKDADSYQDLIESIELQDYIHQEYIETSRGKDIRVYVTGTQVVGAVERYSAHDFRSNIALGGKVKLVNLTEEIKSLSLKVTQALGLTFSGIDLLYGDEGFVVCEANGNAGFHGITKVSTVDIPRGMFQYIQQTYA